MLKPEGTLTGVFPSRPQSLTRARYRTAVHAIPRSPSGLGPGPVAETETAILHLADNHPAFGLPGALVQPGS